MQEKLWVRSIAAGVSFLLPILLLLGSVRLVMTKPYLDFMYKRPHFAEDYLYDWDRQVRLDYGYYGVSYLLNDAPISYLGDLVINGEPAFTERELSHMQDVKGVTRGAMQVLSISVILFVLGSAMLLRKAETRSAWRGAISRGGITTLLISAILMVLALTSWDFFFDTFHAIFFAEGTWEFYNTDTLIRLYPPPFWFYTALIVGVMTLGGAVLCVVVPHWWGKGDSSESPSPAE